MPEQASRFDAILAEVVEAADDKLLLAFADEIERLGALPMAPRVDALVANQSPPSFRSALKGLLSAWLAERPRLPPLALAEMMRTGIRLRDSWRTRSSCELVWTGPFPEGQKTRHTEQALGDVINAVREELWLLSFAFYRFASLEDALEKASARGVAIRLVLESERESKGRIKTPQAVLDQLKSLPGLSVLAWAADRRNKNADGRMGVMHAKAAIADRSIALITSANLTDAAMASNMELGALFKGGPVPGQAASLLEGLLKEKYLLEA